MAIQGKLVPQGPNDEPASVLLEKIHTEKQKLIKEGKIKKDKYDSVIFKGDDNRYYEKIGKDDVVLQELADIELPESWCVCRFSSIANIFTGNSINEQEKAKKYTGLLQGYNYIGTKDVSFNHTINYVNGVKIPFDTQFKIAHKGTPLLCIEGGSAGRKIGILNEDVCFGNKLCAFETYGINSTYLYYFLQSPDFIDVFKSNTTGIIGGVSVNTIKSLFFYLPPLKEQGRIVAEIEKYEPLIAEYDKLEKQKSKLDGEIYDKIKKSILQYAIQGKLVSQDPNDEPASELLKRIRTEKKAQLGKKYADSYIYKGDDNCYYEKIGSEIKNITKLIPFDIPENWSWARLGYIIDFSKNAAVSSNNICDNDWILDLEDIEKASGKLLCKKRMHEVKSKSDKHKFFVGNVLYSKLRPYLNKVIIADEDGYCTTEILAFEFGNNFLNQYAQIYLMSPYFVDYAMAGAYGVKMPRIGSERGNNALIPVPPLVEQKRIVSAYHVIVSKLKDEA